MGGCVSISPHNKNAHTKPGDQIGSLKTKENQTTAASNSCLPQQSAMEHVAGSQDFNGKEEIFFDSQPWLDSDCEDYFSVDGDTPSRVNTPVHPKSFKQATPQHDKVPNMENSQNSVSKSPPKDMTKRLFELFRESLGKDDSNRDSSQHQQEGKPTVFHTSPLKSTSISPNIIHSSGTTPYEGHRSRREKSAQSAQGCIPGLRRSLSSSDRRKRMSPARTSGW